MQNAHFQRIIHEKDLLLTEVNTQLENFCKKHSIHPFLEVRDGKVVMDLAVNLDNLVEDISPIEPQTA